MVTRRAPFEDARRRFSQKAVTVASRNSLQKRSYPYSARMGLLYSVFFSLLLWWIPIAGPAIAGYVSGRKSGDARKALQASLVTTAIIVLASYVLIPFNANGLGLIGRYLDSGLYALSQSQLFAGSSILNSMYSGYTLLQTFTLVLPSSILVLLSFSYAGGVYSELTSTEDGLRDSFTTRAYANTYYATKNVPRVQLESRRLEGWNAYQPSSYEDSGLDWHVL